MAINDDSVTGKGPGAVDMAQTVPQRRRDLPFFMEAPQGPIPAESRRLLEEYSGVPPAKVEEHVIELRNKAWEIFPYPCIGMFRFLGLSIPSSPVYAEVVERLKKGHEKFLDLGCCFGVEIRQLAFEGCPSRNLYGSDLRLDFMELGYDLFLDKNKLEATFMLYGYSNFLPTIIKGLGSWSSNQVQALTIPCYCVGAITYIIVARLSDYYQRRGIFVILFGIVSIIGYALLISPAPAGVHYLGCFIVATGLYVIVGLPLAWLPNNCPRYGKRTACTGMQLTIGTSSGIMSSFIYPTAQGPRYIEGHAITMALVAFAVCVFSFMTGWFMRTNRLRSEGKEDYKIETLTAEEVDELGDESPRFQYMI